MIFKMSNEPLAMSNEKARGALGIYIHVPFCDGKCPYCDFYSLKGNGALFDRYTDRMREAISRWAVEMASGGGTWKVETVYFGGGTPNLLGAGRLTALLAQVKQCFDLGSAAEVTLEANPTSVDEVFFQSVRQAGFNRLSMGLQSANEDELKFLGRKHSRSDAAKAVKAARAAGFENISLDLMLGLPGGNTAKLRNSIAFAAGLGVEHISSYILKVEEGTPFAVRGIEVPDGDEAADQYLFCVEELAKRGYRQYEISNFSKPGRESRHNLVYWYGEEYLGLGPGAHSFLGGRRFFYPRDLAGFLRGDPPCPDGEGGSFGEFAMLNLRLTEGLNREKCREKFGSSGEKAFEAVLKNTKKCPPQLIRADSEKISFTPEGFLVSNALLVELLEDNEE